MKISAMSAGAAGTPGTALNSTNVGVTASAEKLAAAKAIAAGEEAPKEEAKQDPVERAKGIRRIMMKTNYSTNRDDVQIAPEIPAEAPAPESTVSDTVEQSKVAAESTQYITPERAAVAKQRRALQVKERELAAREAKIGQAPEGEFLSKADLIANPLKIFDLGLTYDQLTEAILANQSGITPEIQSLKEELRRVKEDVTKTLTDRDVQAEQQVLSQMKKEAQGLIQSGDDYEMVRETGSLPHVIDLIYRTYKKTGEVLDVRAALNLVETDLITETLKVANLKKVRSKIAPDPVPVQPTSEGKQMRTLTNRDGASIPLDRRSRAIAAMRGTLRK
jgi:hypothetical protein